MAAYTTDKAKTKTPGTIQLKDIKKRFRSGSYLKRIGSTG